jgi:hypothetical protein
MKIKVFMIFFFLIHSLWASPSLFFTKDEINLIHSVNKRTTEISETLHLSAIIYLNQDHWSLWLNNKLIRPQQPLNIKGLQVEQVTPHHVRFVWHSPASSEDLKFTLRPNQIFLLNEKESQIPKN